MADSLVIPQPNSNGIGWSGEDRPNFFHNFDFRNVDKFRRSAIEDPFSNEPTYLTFGIDIDTTNKSSNILDRYTSLSPNPLFNTDSINSAYQFLRQRNYSYKADKLYEFIQLMNLITKDYPWYLDSISGVRDLWKNNSDTQKGFAMDKVKITFTTLESLNLNVTRLADLYREFAYDMVYRREILPDNLQWFDMKIIIAEYRNLYLSAEDYAEDGYNYLDKYKNYLEFDCGMCTFDFSESIPFDQLSSSLIGNSQGPCTNKFSINVGRVVERHNFGLSSAYYISKSAQDAEAAAAAANNANPESSEDRELTKKEIRDKNRQTRRDTREANWNNRINTWETNQKNRQATREANQTNRQNMRNNLVS